MYVRAQFSRRPISFHRDPQIDIDAARKVLKLSRPIEIRWVKKIKTSVLPSSETAATHAFYGGRHWIKLTRAIRPDIPTIQINVMHELTHAAQYEQFQDMFDSLYLDEIDQHGYWRNTFEVEARKNADRMAYLIKVTV